MLLLLLLYPVNAYNNLIIDNYKLVYYIINRKFHYLPIDVKEEVTQDAFIGFIKCAKKYDPNKNYKFTTYAGYYITGYAINSIKRIQRYNNKVIDLTNENYLSFITYDNKNFYDELDNKNIINKFYKECMDKDILYDYFNHKIKKKDIALKYNMSVNQIRYIIEKNIVSFKRNNNINP
tara:strand:- start:1590 stop:2123 length:534 start_codon:yes stop_codon:yes gene_type:complete